MSKFEDSDMAPLEIQYPKPERRSSDLVERIVRLETKLEATDRYLSGQIKDLNRTVKELDERLDKLSAEIADLRNVMAKYVGMGVAAGIIFQVIIALWPLLKG